MDDSLAEWLALREAADWAARSEDVLGRALAALPTDRPVFALDLCTGTGSNLRFLIGRLPRQQRWLVIDRDPAVLAEVGPRLERWGQARGHRVEVHTGGARIRGEHLECDVEVRQMNLGSLDTTLFTGRDLVTASALLDLVSVSWLASLAAACRSAAAAALFTITYDGGSSCDPAEPEDEMVRELLNLHQKTDKGLGGPAAGPDAWLAAERQFAEAGFLVEGASSNWSIGPAERLFQQRLIEGWAGAATELAPERAAAIASWLRRRLQHLDTGRSRVVVSHRDMAAWLP